LLKDVIAFLRAAPALRRSWRIYHSNPDHDRVMDALYARFVPRGGLVFDVGAHVGHRTAGFLRLGARVVAVEPQRPVVWLLRAVYGWRAGVRIVEAACGAREGAITLNVNAANPIVSTASADFIAAAKDAAGWEGQEWRAQARVPLTTLDALIERHGAPDFIKIDVEGFEAEALAGLTRPPPALSFEFTTIQRDVALACVERCVSLGLLRFTAAIGETHALAFDEPVDASRIARWLSDLPAEANSGDVYAMDDAGVARFMDCATSAGLTAGPPSRP
jgi:FkbM family methyltransferase